MVRKIFLLLDDVCKVNSKITLIKLFNSIYDFQNFLVVWIVLQPLSEIALNVLLKLLLLISAQIQRRDFGFEFLKLHQFLAVALYVFYGTK